MPQYYAKVTKSLPSFTHAQKRVADFVLENIETMAFATLEDLAMKIGVSTTTVIRFARILGYKGYSEMQKDIQNEIIDKVSLPERFNTIRESVNLDKLLAETMEADMTNIANTVSSLPEETLRNVIEEIKSARVVHILGMRSSFALAHYTASRFGQIRPNIHLIQSAGMLFPEEMVGVGSEDICIAFLFPRYFKATSNMLSWLRNQRVRVVLFTSPDYTFIQNLGDYFVPCHVKGNAFKNSFAAPLCIINYLASAVALENNGIAQETLCKAEEFLSRGYYFGL